MVTRGANKTVRGADGRGPAGTLPNMSGILYEGALYVLESDCRANVNAALAKSAAERDENTRMRAMLADWLAESDVDRANCLLLASYKAFINK